MSDAATGALRVEHARRGQRHARGQRLEGSDGRWMVGDWHVHAAAHRLERNGESVTLEPRMMAVLAELSRRPGEVVSADALLQACWHGEDLGDNPVHKVIAALRRALNDSATTPTYIETLRRKGYRLVAPVRVLMGQGLRSHQDSRRGQSPFRGLEAFDLAHADVFFGRDRAVAELHARLRAQWARGHPLVVLLGPNGSGKTSLVQAGLVPALFAAESQDVQAPPLRACTAATADLGSADEFGPWAALAGALLDWDVNDAPLLSGFSIDSLALLLRDDPGEAVRLLAVGLAAARSGEAAGAQPPLLVLDRLEALFQLGDAAVAHDFIDCVDRIVRLGRVLTLAICRNDFYHRLATYAPLMRDKERGAHMDLAPPSNEAIAQIIRLPARAAGLTYGTDSSGMNRLDDRLCTDAMHTRDALPLLQYTLQQLYLQRAPGDELSWAAYDAMGGLEGAIGRRAEDTLAELPQGQQEALARVLPRLVGLPVQDAPPIGRWMATADLRDDDERGLVRGLVQARLLVADHQAGKPGCRVAHEALLRSWPRVTSWVAQHRAALAARDQLQPWLQRWLDSARANALLLPGGAVLWQAGRAVAEAPHLFGAELRDYVLRSQARRRRLARWRWGASMGAACLAVVAALAAVRSVQLARIASEREAQSQQLTSFMLGELADQLRPIGRLDLLASLGEQGLRVLARDDASGEAPASALQRAKALVVIGEVNGSRGKDQTATAIAALESAQRLLEPLDITGLKPADYYKTLGAAAFWRGQIAFDQNELDKASAEMRRYRQASERWLAAVPTDAEASAELGFALGSLGAIALRRGAWTEAQRWYEESLALKTRQASQRPDDAVLRRSLATTQTWLGQLAYLRGDFDAALAAYAKARQGLQAVSTAGHAEAKDVYKLGVLSEREGEALRAAGRRADALRAFQAAVTSLARSSRADPGNRWWAAEHLHAESRWLLERADANESIDASASTLSTQLTALQPPSAAMAPLIEQARLHIEVARALSPLRNGDASLAVAARQHLDTALALRPHEWQLVELRARLLMEEIASATARTDAPGLRATCSAGRDAIAPAVRSGQAGLVHEAWLAARRCAGETDAAG